MNKEEAVAAMPTAAAEDVAQHFHATLARLRTKLRNTAAGEGAGLARLRSLAARMEAEVEWMEENQRRLEAGESTEEPNIMTLFRRRPSPVEETHPPAGPSNAVAENIHTEINFAKAVFIIKTLEQMTKETNTMRAILAAKRENLRKEQESFKLIERDVEATERELSEQERKVNAWHIWRRSPKNHLN